MPTVGGKWYESDKVEEDKRVQRGRWVVLHTMDTPTDKKVKVDLLAQVKIDWDKSTGGKPEDIEIGFNRKGWGEQAVGGGDDNTGSRECPTGSGGKTSAVAPWFLISGGPIEFRIFIKGEGYATVYFAEYKVAE